MTTVRHSAHGPETIRLNNRRGILIPCQWSGSRTIRQFGLRCLEKNRLARSPCDLLRVDYGGPKEL